MGFGVFPLSVPHNNPNQDDCLALESPNLAMVAVFDGVSSSKAGRETARASREFFEQEFERLASRSFSDPFSSAFRTWFLGSEARPGAVTRLRKALENKVLHLEAESLAKKVPPLERREFQSTLALAVAVPGHLGVAWVGDSRVYHYSNGRLRCLTRDHQMVDPGVRSDWNEMVYFAYGSSPLDRWNSPDSPPQWYECLDVPLSPGDVFYCSSDGFHDLDYPWRWERRFLLCLLQESDLERVVQRVTAGLSLGENDDTSIAIGAWGEPCALHRFPRIARTRLAVLQKSLDPQLSTLWQRYQFSEDGDFATRRAAMMQAMKCFLEDPPPTDLLGRNTPTGPPRLTSPGPGSALFQDSVSKSLSTAEESGRTRYRGHYIAIYPDDAAPPRYVALDDAHDTTIDVVPSRGDLGSLQLRVERRRGTKWVFRASIPGPTWRIYRALVGEPVISPPATLLLGRTRVEVGKKDLHLPDGAKIGLTPEWAPIALQREDRWASPLQCFVRKDGRKIQIQDREPENGTWLLLRDVLAGHEFELDPFEPGDVLLVQHEDHELGLRFAIAD